MGYQKDLPDALVACGLKVKLVDGWTSRGSSSFTPVGSVGHHTAGPSSGDHPSLDVCINGRPGLSGPLCNTFLPRGLSTAERVVYVVAAGRANHAGEGGYKGLSGNSTVFGCEAESTGVEKSDGSYDWTDWQLTAMPQVHAAHLLITGENEEWYCSHRTWAPDRKIDPTGVGDNGFQSQIGAVLDGGYQPAPPANEEVDMFLCHSTDGRQWLCHGIGKTHIQTMEVVNALKACGVKDYGEQGSPMLGAFPTVEGSDVSNLYAYGAERQVDGLNKLDSLAEKIDALTPPSGP